MKIKFLLFFLIAVWISGFLVEFFIKDLPALALFHPFLNKTYSGVCHQDPNKLISCENAHMLVCARCAGIYFGAFFSSLLAFFYVPEFKLKSKYLIYASAPVLLDVILTTIGVYAYTKTAAFLTGFLLGSISFFYILGSLQMFFEDVSHKRKVN